MSERIERNNVARREFAADLHALVGERYLPQALGIVDRAWHKHYTEQLDFELELTVKKQYERRNGKCGMRWEVSLHRARWNFPRQQIGSSIQMFVED